MTAGPAATRQFGRLVVLAALLLPFQASPCRAFPPDSAEAQRIDPLTASVAKVVTVRGEGSGFLVRADGAFVTAFHVVVGAREVWAHFPSGKACRVEGVLLARPDLDLVVLKLSPAQLPPGVTFFPLNTTGALTSGMPARALGYPRGTGPLSLPGTLLSRAAAGASRPRLLQVVSGIQPGCSGGPLVDAGGAALGVVVAGIGEERLGFASELGHLGPLPEPGSRILSLEEAGNIYNGSPGEAYARGLEVLQFWKHRAPDKASERAAREWALAQFQTACRQDPGMLDAQFHVGLCEWWLGRLPAALVAMRRVLEIDPDQMIGRYFLSAIYHKMGRRVEAVQIVREALRTCPTFPSGHRLLASYFVADKAYPAALPELRTAVQLQPDEPKTRSELGHVLMELRRYPEALAEYQKLVQLKPESWEGQYALGRTYAALKRYPEARAAYRAALRLRPDYAAARYHLAVAALAQGERAAAQSEYTALKDFGSPLARRLRGLLRRRGSAR